MKSVIKFLLIAIIATTIIPLSSCKKGANDPFLSLRSRASRLSGKWTLASQDYTIITVNGNITKTDVYSFDGTFVTVVNKTKIGGSAETTQTNKYAYAELWEFTKDNTYTNTVTSSGVSYTDEGNWAFLNKDKAAELKNKEAVTVNSTKFTFGSNVTTTGKVDLPTIFVLDELKKSEMIVIMDEAENNSATDYKTTKGTRTYKK